MLVSFVHALNEYPSFSSIFFNISFVSSSTMRLPPARSLYPSIQPGRQKTISSSPTTLALLPTRIPAFTHIITRAVTPQPPSPSDLRALYTIHTLPDIQLATKTALHAAQTAPEYLRARPVAAHTRQAFEKFLAWRARAEARAHLCLDAGCGHGNSTSHLARLHTDCDVIGIDRSYARLARRDTKTDNAMLLRAELADFWRLCWEYKVSFKYQFILYPNPYPKRRHIKVRFKHNV